MAGVDKDREFSPVDEDDKCQLNGHFNGDKTGDEINDNESETDKVDERKTHPVNGNLKSSIKKSRKYGIQQSLERRAIKYTRPKTEIFKAKNPCSPCSRENKQVEAPKYCPECDENLCSDCVILHGKFQLLKAHNVVDVNKTSEAENSTEKAELKLSNTCTKHAGKPLNLFCSHHDEVICTACVAMGHKQCPEPQNITKVAANIVQPGLLKTTKEELASLKKDVFLVKMKRMGDKNRITKEYSKILSTIEKTKARFIETLGKLESQAKLKLNSKFERDINDIKKDIQKCDKVLGTLDEAVQKLKTNNAVQLMINIKKDANVSLKRAMTVVKTVSEKLGRQQLQFTIDESVENWLGEWTTLGHFQHEDIVYSAVLSGEFDMNLNSGSKKEESTFNSLLALSNGSLLVSDWKNRQLNLLDIKYKVKCTCVTPGMPYSMCCVNPNLVAVTIRDEKLVQFVTVEASEMQLERKFKVDEYCRGIAHSNGLVYITCGGPGEIQGQIRAYTLQGALARVYETDNQERPLFIQPKNIAIGDNNAKIHVLDAARGVVTLTKEGRLVSVFHDSHLKSPLGICLDELGNVFVCDSNSNNIVQLNADGKQLGVILSEKDGISKPVAMCCQGKSDLRLILASENSSVFQEFTLQ